MKILIAEDEVDMREPLVRLLARWDHEVTAAADGVVAWEEFRKARFDVVISDWRMPRMDGISLCKSIRSLCRENYTYIVMVTAVSGRTSYIEALDAGADDFISKPFDRDVLAAKLRVAERILRLHTHVTALEGLLPICCYCKQIRNDSDRWLPVEQYVESHSGVKFSHSICPGCMKKHHSDTGGGD